jgi:mannosyltransferase
MNSESPQSSPPIYLLACILLLAGALRFYGLGDESLWLDEALSWQQSSLPLGELLASIAVDVHPPLYALLLHACIALFGDGEWALRLLSAVCGTLSVALIWAVARRVTNERAALVAALLCAISLFAIRYSQEARMYALLNFLALLSMLMLLRMDDNRDPNSQSAARQAAYLAATVLMMYSHVYALFVLIAQNIYMFVRYLPGWKARPALAIKSWFGLQAMLALFFAPWLYVLLKQIGRVQTSFWINKPDLDSLVGTFELYMAVMPALLLALVIAAWAIICLFSTAKVAQPSDENFRPHNATTALLLFAWLLTPVLLPFLISQLMQPIYMPRYTIASSSAWYILVATGIACMRPAWLRTVVLALLVVGMGGALPFYYGKLSKTNWPAAVSYVENGAAAGDLVLFHNPDVIVPYRYYAKRTDLELRTVIAEQSWQAAGVSIQDKPDVRPLVGERRQVWLVSGYDAKTAISEIELLNQLGSKLGTVKGQEFSAIRVFRFTSQ